MGPAQERWRGRGEPVVERGEAQRQLFRAGGRSQEVTSDGEAESSALEALGGSARCASSLGGARGRCTQCCIARNSVTDFSVNFWSAGGRFLTLLPLCRRTDAAQNELDAHIGAAVSAVATVLGMRMSLATRLSLASGRASARRSWVGVGDSEHHVLAFEEVELPIVAGVVGVGTLAEVVVVAAELSEVLGVEGDGEVVEELGDVSGGLVAALDGTVNPLFPHDRRNQSRSFRPCPF